MKKKILLIFISIIFILVMVRVLWGPRDYVSSHQYCDLCLLGYLRTQYGTSAPEKSDFENVEFSERVISLYPAHTEHRWSSGSGGWIEYGFFGFTKTGLCWDVMYPEHHRLASIHTHLTDESLLNYISSIDDIDRRMLAEYHQIRSQITDDLSKEKKEEFRKQIIEIGDQWRDDRLVPLRKLLNANPQLLENIQDQAGIVEWVEAIQAGKRHP